MLLTLLLFFCFASLFGLSKAGLEHAEPFFFVGSRMFLAGVAMTAYSWIQRRRKGETWAWPSWGSVLVLAMVNIYLTNIAEIWGIQHLVSAKACLLYSLSPFCAALFSYFLLGEVLTQRKWIGLGLGFVGLIPIFVEDSLQHHAGAPRSGHDGRTSGAGGRRHERTRVDDAAEDGEAGEGPHSGR